MFFDDRMSEKAVKYGIGRISGNGKFHLLASPADRDRIQPLCLSRQWKTEMLSGRPGKWFDEEVRAVQALRKHKKACQKCLRVIESIEFNLPQNP